MYIVYIYNTRFLPFVNVYSINKCNAGKATKDRIVSCIYFVIFKILILFVLMYKIIATIN